MSAYHQEKNIKNIFSSQNSISTISLNVNDLTFEETLNEKSLIESNLVDLYKFIKGSKDCNANDDIEKLKNSEAKLQIEKETKLKEIDRINYQIRICREKIDYKSKDRETMLYRYLLNLEFLEFKSKKFIFELKTGLLWPNPNTFDFNTCKSINHLIT